MHHKRCVTGGEMGLDRNVSERQREWVVLGAL